MKLFILLALVAVASGCSSDVVREAVSEQPLTIRSLHRHNNQLQGSAGAKGFEGMVAYDVFTNATPAGENLFWVKKRREFDAEDVASVSIQTPDGRNPLLIVTLTRAGARKLGHGKFNPSPSAPIGLAVFEGQRLLAVGTLAQFPDRLDTLPLETVYIDTLDRKYKQLIQRNRTEQPDGAVTQEPAQSAAP